MAKTATTITTSSGKKASGYISNGKTYYSDGSRIKNGDTVTDNSGREWKMTSNGGVATGNNYSISGNSGAYKGKTNNTTSSSSDYSSILKKQLQAQQDAINSQKQATIDSINAYKPQINQAYSDQQKANYIANERNKMGLGDFLSANGLSGGMAESTASDINNTYQNNRLSADTEKNTALANLQNQVAQAEISADTNSSDAMSGYYNNLLTALQNQQQFDYNKQLNDKSEYANTVGAYSNDYQAEINRIKANVANGDTSEQWKLNYLNSARQDKIASQASSQADAEQQAYENYLKEQNLAINQAKANYQINKPYYKASSSGTKISASTAWKLYEQGKIDQDTLYKYLGV